MRLYVKDLGGVPVVKDLMLRRGTSTNDSAAAGNVGEYIESVIASGSAVSLTTATYANMTSIPLTAGDWDVTAVFEFTGNAATVVSALFGTISLTSNTQDLTNGRVACLAYPAGFAPFAVASPNGFAVPSRRFSLSAATTIYATALASFTVNSCSVYGTLSARRMR